jgi:Tol biopolymer transport system component
MLLAAGCRVQRQAAPVGVDLLEVRGVTRATDRAALSPVAWAPDGRRFAYGGRDGVWVHRLGDAVGTRVAPGEVVTAVAWSAPADVLAVVDRGALWTMRPDGRVRRRIGAPGPVSRVAWAPGGDRLAIVVHRMQAGTSAGQTELWWTGPDGSTVRQIQWAPPGRRVVALGWYPDALYLFVGLATDGEAAVEWWRVRIAYPDFRQLADPPAPVLDSVLSPTGEWIAYVAVGNAGQRAYVVRPDGSGRHAISPEAARIAGLAWSPHADKVAYGVLLDERQAEVFVAAAGVTAVSGPPGRPVASYRVEFPDPAVTLSLAWAPDEAHLAYGTNTGAFAGPVWLVRFGPR